MRVNPLYVSNLVNALDQATATQQSLSEQLASGRRVNVLSDDPVASGRNVLLSDQISSNDSFTHTASSLNSMLQVTDTALGAVTTQLNQAISLATAANNGTMNADNCRPSLPNSSASAMRSSRWQTQATLACTFLPGVKATPFHFLLQWGRIRVDLRSILSLLPTAKASS